jgi:hypothetical protein
MVPGLWHILCLYRFHEYVSYGFPSINLCNPGVHYETPCISFEKCVNRVQGKLCYVKVELPDLTVCVCNTVH